MKDRENLPERELSRPPLSSPANTTPSPLGDTLPHTVPTLGVPLSSFLGLGHLPGC